MIGIIHLPQVCFVGCQHVAWCPCWPCGKRARHWEPCPTLSSSSAGSVTIQVALLKAIHLEPLGSKPHPLYPQWWDVNSYVDEEGLVVVLKLEGLVKSCSVKNLGTKPVMNVYSQVLGFSPCLVWPHCIDACPGLSKSYSSRNHTCLWDQMLSRNQEKPWLLGDWVRWSTFLLFKVRSTDPPHHQHHLGAY